MDINSPFPIGPDGPRKPRGSGKAIRNRRTRPTGPSRKKNADGSFSFPKSMSAEDSATRNLIREKPRRKIDPKYFAIKPSRRVGNSAIYKRGK